MLFEFHDFRLPMFCAQGYQEAQIQDRQAKKLEEKKKLEAEEQKEMLRLERERVEMQQAFEREKQSAKQKQNEDAKKDLERQIELKRTAKVEEEKKEALLKQKEEARIEQEREKIRLREEEEIRKEQFEMQKKNGKLPIPQDFEAKSTKRQEDIFNPKSPSGLTSRTTNHIPEANNNKIAYNHENNKNYEFSLPSYSKKGLFEPLDSPEKLQDINYNYPQRVPSRNGYTMNPSAPSPKKFQLLSPNRSNINSQKTIPLLKHNDLFSTSEPDSPKAFNNQNALNGKTRVREQLQQAIKLELSHDDTVLLAGNSNRENTKRPHTHQSNLRSTNLITNLDTYDSIDLENTSLNRTLKTETKFLMPDGTFMAHNETQWPRIQNSRPSTSQRPSIQTQIAPNQLNNQLSLNHIKQDQKESLFPTSNVSNIEDPPNGLAHLSLNDTLGEIVDDIPSKPIVSIETLINQQTTKENSKYLEDKEAKAQVDKNLRKNKKKWDILQKFNNLETSDNELYKVFNATNQNSVLEEINSRPTTAGSTSNSRPGSSKPLTHMGSRIIQDNQHLWSNNHLHDNNLFSEYGLL